MAAKWLGNMVELKGLKRAALNGSRGTVTMYLPDVDRCVVALDDEIVEVGGEPAPAGFDATKATGHAASSGS